MTGIRTFIRGNGRSKRGSIMLQSGQGDEDVWPLSKNGQKPETIRVRQELAMKSERVSISRS